MARPACKQTSSDGQEAAVQQIERMLTVPYPKTPLPDRPVLQVIRQDFAERQSGGKVSLGKSFLGTPLRIGSRTFEHGLGSFALSHFRIWSPEPIARFEAWVGVDVNEQTVPTESSIGNGSVYFAVSTDKKKLYASPHVHLGGEEPEKIDVDVEGSQLLDLRLTERGDGSAYNFADWADAVITLQDGRRFYLDELSLEPIRDFTFRYPFSFKYNGKPIDDVLETWKQEKEITDLSAERQLTVTEWADPKTGLKVSWEATRFKDFPAAEWVLYFENTGESDTPIIDDVQAMELVMNSPRDDGTPYLLQRTNGSPSRPWDFEPSILKIDNTGDPIVLGGGEGRSSNKDFPFYKIESGSGSVIVAVGWSGQWRSRFSCPDNHYLRIEAGMEKTHFRLHPGERVRTPRMLVMFWDGPDTLESNAQFRQLIYKHYAAKWNGETTEPIMFCNTCFTRGGMWLNECNEQNQISLIKAYAPLGLQALITDAGWFEGGWPNGAGNWNPRKDAYPNGIAPVAAAAEDNGMMYGLWFEIERVVKNTSFDREHPDWVLRVNDPQAYGLANFGLPEVQEHFFNIVKGFMELPGFRFYRQDFNMNPLEYWRHNDTSDRRGVTEMKYIEGLYAYWDRIAETWPDSLREECSSGGRRIDLETVKRMHLHQKSDHWFDNVADQGTMWGLSQYLPNNVYCTPIDRLDTYTFHSIMAGSLVMGWITDAPDFDFDRGKELIDIWQKHRHLLVGAWYPLLPYNRDTQKWNASQYHRPDLDEGLILVFRGAESPYSTVELKLHGLKSESDYELRFSDQPDPQKFSGRQLMAGLKLNLLRPESSNLIHYRKTDSN